MKDVHDNEKNVNVHQLQLEVLLFGSIKHTENWNKSPKTGKKIKFGNRKSECILR